MNLRRRLMLGLKQQLGTGILLMLFGYSYLFLFTGGGIAHLWGKLLAIQRRYVFAGPNFALVRGEDKC